MKQPLVYVAGPISKGAYWDNVRNGINVGQELIERGLIPFIPHLDFLWVLLHPKTWEDCLRYDEQIILRCDALLRMPGESQGADREVAFAHRHKIPVFQDIEALVQWAAELPPVTCCDWET